MRQTLQTQALCEVPRGGLQLLPYYIRVAASLNQVFPDIGQGTQLPPSLTLLFKPHSASHSRIAQIPVACSVACRAVAMMQPCSMLF